MKKTENKPGPSSARKTLRKDLESGIINDLKVIIATLGSGSPKLGKKITKEAGKIAKKLAKEITPHSSSNVTPVIDATKITEFKKPSKTSEKASPVKTKAVGNSAIVAQKKKPK